MPCLTPRGHVLHHGEQQGHQRLVRSDPAPNDRGCHAFGTDPSHWKSNHIGGFDGLHRRKGEEVWIAGAHPDNSETERCLLIDDGQRIGRPGARR